MLNENNMKLKTGALMMFVWPANGVRSAAPTKVGVKVAVTRYALTATKRGEVKKHDYVNAHCPGSEPFDGRGAGDWRDLS